ncbi:Tripartite motif-containing protein 15 [Varanus komodoensis]|nr:Tripartite motif-containing protein 15 [Varanus komodoensis]
MSGGLGGMTAEQLLQQRLLRSRLRSSQHQQQAVPPPHHQALIHGHPGLGVGGPLPPPLLPPPCPLSPPSPPDSPPPGTTPAEIPAGPRYPSETWCSLCRVYCPDPVCLPCGHNFCTACIGQRLGEPKLNISCLECGATARKRNLRPIKPPPLLASLERVQTQLEILKQEKNTLWSQKLIGEMKIQEYTEKVQAERKEILSEFERLHQFLKDQEQRLLTQLEELDKQLAKQKNELITHITEELCRVGRVIAEMEVKCRQPASEFLQMYFQVLQPDLKAVAKLAWMTPFLQVHVGTHRDIKKNMSRCLPGQFPSSDEACSKLEKRLEDISRKGAALKETLNRFQDNIRYAVDKGETVKTLNDKVNMALDVPSALLSLDQRNMGYDEPRHRLPALEYVPDVPKNLDSRALVLGCDGFTSGRYFWELEVGDGEFWAVGVTRDPAKKKGMMDFSPEEGIWAVGLWKGQHWALTSPVTALSLSQHPRRIRVSLDYVGECVTFTDADTDGPIFTFPPASFNGARTHPLLWVVGFPAQSVFLRRMGVKYPTGVHEMDVLSP